MAQLFLLRHLKSQWNLEINPQGLDKIFECVIITIVNLTAFSVRRDGSLYL